MPTTYAHYRYGEMVYTNLPQNLKEIINNNRQLYDIGVNGPDILFYHHPFPKDDIFLIGANMHDHSAKDFFTKAKDIYLKRGKRNDDLAYLLGFLAHFSLDSATHSYIERKDELSNASHFKIEAEFDRFLMIEDHKDPLKVNTVAHLFPTKKNSEIIASYFPIDDSLMYKTLKRMKFLLKLLEVHSPIKRFLFKTVTGIAHASSFMDMTFYKDEDPLCKDSNLRLLKLMNKAAPSFNELALSLISFLNNEGELIAPFNETFAYHEGYKDIPILSYEEELNYHI